MTEPGLRLRALRPEDEEEFVAGHRVMEADGFPFGLSYTPGMPWADFLRHHENNRLGRDISPGYVPSTFLVAEVDGHIVGRTSIRHELNEFLLHEGGHIGYGVLPPFRRKGYAGEILRQSLEVARSLGIDDVLVCCDDDNATSARVIERAGGQLESVVLGRDGVPVRRYWIRRPPASPDVS